MKNFIFLSVLCGMVLFGCKSEEDEMQENTLYSEQVAALEAGVISPALIEMDLRTNALDFAVNEFTAAPDQERLENVREAFFEARVAYQSVSMLRFGPAEAMDLQLRANTFPVDTTAIESLIQGGVETGGEHDEMGFAAMGWLLYGYGNAPEIIEAYTSDDHAPTRIEFLRATTTALVSLFSDHKASWDDGYRGTFLSAAGASAGSAMSLYVNGLIKDYETLKREKIALPLGLLTLGIPLPDRAEAFHAEYSVALSKAHLTALQNAFTGGTGSGLDDLLIELDAFHSPSNQTLSNAILNQFEASQSALNGLSDPLTGEIQNNPDLVEAAYDELQAAVVLLKADMPSALGISITFTDNDGD